MSTNDLQLHVHKLAGCGSRPLAHYLKALGVLRLVADQADTEARGFWRGGVFHLVTVLDEAALKQFFLEAYEPTPLLAPWNRGSGFYKEGDPGLSPIEQSTDKRFKQFRDAIADARGLLKDIQYADSVVRAIKACTNQTAKGFQNEDQRQLLLNDSVFQSVRAAIERRIGDDKTKPEERVELRICLQTVDVLVAVKKSHPNKVRSEALKGCAGYKQVLDAADRRFKALKESLIPDCRREWRGGHADWMSSVVALNDENRPYWAALFGSGGNDGNLEFTNNFMQRLVDIFGLNAKGEANGELVSEASNGLLEALWGVAMPVRESEKPIGGHFYPQAAGDRANGSTGFTGKVRLNSWDFVLMLEGAVVLVAGLSRRAESIGLGQAIAPFAFRSVAAGYGNAADPDAGPRGEQWMPLWKAAASISEVRQLFREARVVINGKPAQDGIQMARAIAQRGVDRRLVGFERYSYMQRNGDAHFAVPLGRIAVPSDVSAHQTLVEEVADWVDRLRHAGRDKFAPAAITRSARLAGDALFACTQADTAGAGSVFRHLLLTLAEAEDQLVRSPKFSGDPKHRLRPLSQGNGRALSSGWVQVIHSGLSEKDQPAFRLALALSQQHACDEAGKRWPIRAHWLPLDRSGHKFKIAESGLAMGPEQAASGRSLEQDLVAVMRRRRLKMGSVKAGLLPLGLSRPEIGATLSDVVAFLAGGIDGVQVLSLARGLMAVDAGRWREESANGGASWEGTDLSIYGVLRLAMPAPGMQLEALAGSGSVRAAGAILAQLEAGQTDRAIETACRRLGACGQRVPFRVTVSSPQMGIRLAASLAIPLRPSALRRLKQQVLVADQAAV